jgi:membrane protease YdiL (CAAX protease family)
MQPEDVSAAGSPPTEIVISPKIEDERDPFWGYADLVLLTFWSFLVMLAASLCFHFYPKSILEIQIAAYVVMFLGFRAAFKFSYDRGVFASLGWRKTGQNLIWAALGGVLLALAINVVASLVKTPKVKTPFDDLGNTPLSMALLALVAVCLAPLSEEMFFRGFWQPLLSKTFGTAAGVLITALLFGALHGSEYQWAWQYVAAITIVGLTLGTVRARTNSIIPGTVMHGCFNSLSVFALLYQKYIIHK